MQPVSATATNINTGEVRGPAAAAPKPEVMSARQILWQIWAWQPCTLRGFVAILLSTVAVRTLAVAEFDLVANILGWSVLALTAVTLLVVFLFRLRVSGQLQIAPHFASLSVHSETPIPGGLTLKSSSLPPFLLLELRRVFAHGGVVSPTHVITGYQAPASHRILVDSVVFPHRGLWELLHIECRLSDALGFCALSWRFPLHHRIQVSAPTIPIEPLPIVASSHRSGEELSTSAERTGDLFDIKAYDPSDGIKRILWKTYARSGELVARRPEPAAIPDGELGIFLIADRTEDFVAGALQDYLEQLRRHDIEVLFGTDTLTTSGHVKREQDIQEAIDGDVWNVTAGTGRGFLPFLESLERSGRSIEQIVIFSSATNSKWVNSIKQSLERFPARGNVVLVDSSMMETIGRSSVVPRSANRVLKFRGARSGSTGLPKGNGSSVVQGLSSSGFDVFSAHGRLRVS